MVRAGPVLFAPVTTQSLTPSGTLGTIWRHDGAQNPPEYVSMRHSSPNSTPPQGASAGKGELTGWPKWLPTQLVISRSRDSS
jgi:hypothetical protein